MFRYLQNALRYPKVNILFCLEFFVLSHLTDIERGAFFFSPFWASLEMVVCGGCHWLCQLYCFRRNMKSVAAAPNAEIVNGLVLPLPALGLSGAEPKYQSVLNGSGAGSGWLTAAGREHVQPLM